jgi:large subunit ribosomal protein L4
MAQITLKNVAGKDAGKVDLDDATFGIQPNVPCMHQVVTAQLAARRAGTQSTKTRAEVRGGGRKPFAQKGTGNARQGSIRAPHFSGGGVALGPKPRKYGQNTPKKMIKLALRSALSDRANEGKIIVVSEWGWDKPNTKTAKAALAGLGVNGKALVVVGRDDAAAALSFRNLTEVQVIAPGELNAYDVLCNDWIVFTESTLPVDTPKPPKPAKPATAEPVAAEPVPKSAAQKSSKKPSAPDEGSASDESDGGSSRSEAEASPDPKDGSSRIEAEASPDPKDGSSRIEAEASPDHPEWEGAVNALADGSQPEGYDIKGNADSMLYHTPGSRFYKQTAAEVWFATEEAAEAAGFSKPASQQAAEDADAPDEGSASDESDGGSSQSEAEASPDHKEGT